MSERFTEQIPELLDSLYRVNSGARVALTLREVCGLTTEEIAKAFLITPRTLAQRTSLMLR